MEEELNTDWITQFEKVDQKYEKFYKKKVTTINVFFLYVDRYSNLFYIKKNKENLTDNGVLEKINLINLLKKNMIHNSKKYRPISILQYNITLNPNNIKSLIKKPQQYDFINPQDSIQDLKWDNSIEYFTDMNSLHIIFFETWKDKRKKTNTKKIYIKSTKSNNKKTKRKHLKV